MRGYNIKDITDNSQICSWTRLSYHFYQRSIAVYSWEKIKVTVEINFSNYGHILLTTKEFIDISSNI